MFSYYYYENKSSVLSCTSETAPEAGEDALLLGDGNVVVQKADVMNSV
jgi:hypothetical protein